MIRKSLDHLVFLESEMKELDEKIAAALKPQEREYELLQTIPGVSAQTAAVIMAETGGNMAQFPSDRHLTSWAGVCPGNNRSAGKQKERFYQARKPKAAVGVGASLLGSGAKTGDRSSRSAFIESRSIAGGRER